MTNELPKLKSSTNKQGKVCVKWGQPERDIVFDGWGRSKKHKGVTFICSGIDAGAVDVAFQLNGYWRDIQQQKATLHQYIYDTFNATATWRTVSYNRTGTRLQVARFFPLGFEGTVADENTVHELIEYIVRHTRRDQYEVSEDTVSKYSVQFTSNYRATKNIMFSNQQLAHALHEANIKLRERYCRILEDYNRRTIHSVNVITRMAGHDHVEIVIGANHVRGASDTSTTRYLFVDPIAAYKFLYEWKRADKPWLIDVGRAMGNVAMSIAHNSLAFINGQAYDEALERGEQL